jgi:hypothetical protein
MSNSLSSALMAGPIVEAGLYASQALLEAQPAASIPTAAAAMAAARAARVDLYCDHDGLALAHIDQARQALRAVSRVADDSLIHLDHARWSTLHHRYREAAAELDAALARMALSVGPDDDGA